MKKALRKDRLFYFGQDGKKIDGPNPSMSGICTALRGECTALSGECTALSGNCSAISGNFDDCELSDEDRKKGIDIKDLIGD